MKEQERAKSKSGLYGLENHCFRFYYAFVYPYLSEIQEGFKGIVIEETVIPRIDQYVSLVFEQVAMEQVRLWTKKAGCPFHLSELDGGGKGTGKLIYWDVI